MANPEHLAKLKEGVEVWNAWRAENEGVRVDLSDANLRRANLTGALMIEEGKGRVWRKFRRT